MQSETFCCAFRVPPISGLLCSHSPRCVLLRCCCDSASPSPSSRSLATICSLVRSGEGETRSGESKARVVSATSITTYCWGLFIYIYSSSAPTGGKIVRRAGTPFPPSNPMFGTWHIVRVYLPTVMF
jgi:hypothetical protein